MLKAIVDFKPEFELKRQNYNNYRAVLIGGIVYRSAQRVGVVHGLRKVEVANAQMQNEHLKLIIYQYKTGKLKPAIVYLEKLSSQAFLNFLNTIIPIIDKGSEINGPLFISEIVKKMTHTAIQNSLHKLISLSGSKKSITSTKSRIAAATYIANSNPGNTQIVADYMQHQASTADKYYRQLGEGKELISAFDAIGKMKVN